MQWYFLYDFRKIKVMENLTFKSLYTFTLYIYTVHQLYQTTISIKYIDDILYTIFMYMYVYVYVYTYI